MQVSSQPTPAPIAPAPGGAPMLPGATSTATQVVHKVASTAPFMIKPVKQQQKWLKLLVYGKHGSGKTTLAGSAADVKGMGDILMLDCESGTMTIDQNPRIKNIDVIDSIEVKNFKMAATIHEYLKAHCRARDDGNIDQLRKLQSIVTGVPPDQIETPRRYQTVMIDSLTELDQYCMYQLLGVSQETKIDTEMEVAQFAEFRKNNQMVQLLTRAFRDLPMHVIIVCAAQYVQDEFKRMHFTPSLTGKLSAQVQGFMDVVGYLIAATSEAGEAMGSQEGAPRRLYVQPVGKFDAKCRRAGFRQAYFDNPTMSSIMQGFGLANPA